MMWRCDNCKKVFALDKVKDVHSEDLICRNDEGMQFSAHECPDCGGLVFPWFDPFTGGQEQIDVEAWRKELADENATFILRPHQIDWAALFQDVSLANKYINDFKKVLQKHKKNNTGKKQPIYEVLVNAGDLQDLVMAVTGLLNLVHDVQFAAAEQVIGDEMVFGYEKES